MSFTEAVLWWEGWQLRFLVLCSLFIQCFLCFASILRKRCIPSWLRFLIWLAYLGSDAVAIYALATLFNHNKEREWVSTHHSSTSLQVLWAPILLVHLGGQDAITAYNIEDNELWRRHVLTAVSQVTVAVYVFSKSWSGDKRILAAAALLFFAGILKCVLKPWDLKRVSINSLVDSSTGSEENGKIRSLDEYVQAAKEYFQADRRGHPSDGNEEPIKPYNLCVDIAPSYCARLSWTKCFMVNATRAHDLLRWGLAATFERLYTKKGLYFKELRKSFVFFSTNLAFIWSAIILTYHHHRKEIYNHTDFMITNILICLTCILEMSRHIDGILIRNTQAPWPDQVAQYNLIGYLARNQRHSTLRMLATSLICKDYLDQLWCMKPCKSSCNITKLVHGYIKTGWQQINGTISYRRFNDNRGQWTLEREGLLKILGWSLRRPFDESVFLWHLATDLCFHHMDTPPTDEAAHRSREMSNYMVYLLFVNPEMLIPGARPTLFRDTYNKLKDIPLYEKPPLDEKVLAQNIIHRVMDRERSGVVHDAWAIAQELVVLYREDEGKIWRVIQGVWVEMLCFSASRCRGYLHAKSLGKGGEYLSYVWLLMLYMGMETLAEKMLRSELHEERDEGGSAGDPRSASPVTDAEEIMFDKRRGAFDTSIS